MTASFIPQVKRIIRGIDFESCRSLAEEALAATTYKQVQALVSRRLSERFPSPGISDFIGNTRE
jgi:phosphoenolpyruvate-protein kinase (PTS system EI component)